MNITLSVEETLVKIVREIAIKRKMTLAGLVRAYLQDLAASIDLHKGSRAPSNCSFL